MYDGDQLKHLQSHHASRYQLFYFHDNNVDEKIVERTPSPWLGKLFNFGFKSVRVGGMKEGAKIVFGDLVLTGQLLWNRVAKEEEEEEEREEFEYIPIFAPLHPLIELYF